MRAMSSLPVDVSNREVTEGSDERLSLGPFRIHTVAELTGVPEPTLRAWERRYGVPTPERTASGYRLYGPREVEQVREMRRLCDEGMAASEAARLIAAARPTSAAQGVGVVDAYGAAVKTLIQAIADLDDVAFDEQLGRAAYLGASTTVFDRVLAPTLVRVGELWHQGELSVAQEHFATRRIAALVDHFARLAVAEDASDSVVVACFADELHEVGALGFAMRAATWGLRPLVLGARTPPGAVRTAVSATAPKMVALSATVAPERARARELVDGYASACGSVPWIVGGAAVSSIADLVRKAGGLVAPADTVGLRALVRDLMSRRIGQVQVASGKNPRKGPKVAGERQR